MAGSVEPRDGLARPRNRDEVFGTLDRSRRVTTTTRSLSGSARAPP